MDSTTQLQQNRLVIQDFAASTLAAIPSLFAQLTYMASLRDLSSGRYEHAGLTAVYPRDAVQQALEHCHEEIFERVLEIPLAQQASDLKAHLQGMPGGFALAVSTWRKLESYRALLPAEAPIYLKGLFCSNTRALLEILAEDYIQARSVA